MAFQKLLRGNVTILAAYPEAFADWTHPTAAELNARFAYGTNEDALVFDVSCAILDDYTLNMTDPETDDSISICDIGEVSSPTFDNYEASLDGFRDKSLTADGVFNLFWNLFKGPDRPYFLVKIIGPAQGSDIQIGDVVSLYGVNTDFPVDLVEDNTMLQLGARFKTNGLLNINYRVEA